MKRALWILLLALTPAVADQADICFREGNSYFEKGQYQDAINAYERAMGTGYESAELYFNLANAYFKTEHLGKSILFYERANRLQPNDADITYNLELARLRAVDKILTPPDFFLARIWRGLLHLLSSGQWGVVALIFYLLTLSLIIARLLYQKASFTRWSGFILAPLLVVTLLASAFFFLSLNQAHSERQAIILVDKADVYSSPSTDGTEVFALHEGTKVHLGERSGAFVRIALADGKVGWIRLDTLEEI